MKPASSPPLRLRRLPQQPDLPLEVAEILEALVDAGEPDVRHVVRRLQLLQDVHPDLLARRLRRNPAPRLLTPLERRQPPSAPETFAPATDRHPLVGQA